MADNEGGYNPIGYHVGTAWPFDNSIIALGLRNYGFKKEAARVALANLEAAKYFRYRLPEAFEVPQSGNGFSCRVSNRLQPAGMVGGRSFIISAHAPGFAAGG